MSPSPLIPSDAALDAGAAAWFGVTKVEDEKNFIRSRMRAAVRAVLDHPHAQAANPNSLKGQRHELNRRPGPHGVD